MGFFDDIEDSMNAKAEEQEELMSAEKWDPAEGEILQGVLLKVDDPITQYGPALVLTVRNVGEDTSGGVEPGKSASVWCSTVLQRLVLEEQPKIGKALAIRYEGLRDNKDGSNQYKAYTLMVEESAPDEWLSFGARPLDVRDRQPETNEPEDGWF